MNKAERLLNKKWGFFTRGHDFVEMGGIKWATCNIGAEKPTDYGRYIQWKDAEDMVHSQWGGKWRLPTSNDFRTLLHSDIIHRWKVNYHGSGINGVIFYDGDNELFFPASGHCDSYNKRIFGEETSGYYWSRDFSNEQGTDLSFIEQSVLGIYNDNKRLGFSVRPILKI